MADPGFVLAAWSGGVALAAGLVARWGRVGPGYMMLSGATSVLVGLATVFGDDAWASRVGIVLVGVAAALVSRVPRSWPLFVVGGLLISVQGALIADPLLALTATVALGGVTGEMLLGHWFLVDPRLPRWMLTVLAVIGIVGMTADLGVVILTTDAIDPWGFSAWVLLGLGITTILLMVAVIGAIRYPAYSGVMAATGLSYLAILTALATIFLGRYLGSGQMINLGIG